MKNTEIEQIYELLSKIKRPDLATDLIFRRSFSEIKNIIIT